MRRQPLAATIVLVALVAAPFALAQTTTTPKKKGAKPAASASAAAPDPTPDPGAPSPPPADSASTDTKPATDLPATPPEKEWDVTDTKEDPNKSYYFIGARYRGTIIPQFMLNLFVADGATIYSNTAALELDIRSNNHSTIPWIGYTGFGFGDTLFREKSKPDEPDNYTIVSSSLWGLFLGLDELWSVPMDTSHHWDFEFGFGVGLGVIFGTLTNDWAYQTNDNTGIKGSNGNYYSICPTTVTPANATPGAENGCDAGHHSNSTVNKVGHYAEPNWFNGGSVPVLFPQIYFPTLGVRYEPVKNFEARLGVGFSLTGFWFGVSGNYGFERQTDAAPSPSPAKKDAGGSGTHGML